MKKTIYITVLLILIAVFLTGCADINVNLLKGGDFEYADTDEVRESWKLSSGGSETSSVFTVSNGALGINTSTAGWAYAAQELQLKSNAYYKVTYTYSITSISYYGEATSYDGLFIGFLEDKDFNIGESPDGVIKPLIHNGTTNGYVTGEFFFKTTYITKASLAIFVGTEEGPVSANVKIDDITLERVRKNAVTVTEDPDTGKDVIVAFKLDTDTFGAHSDKNIVFIVLGCIFTFALGYVVYIMFRRNMALEEGFTQGFLTKLRDSEYWGIALVIAFTAFIRLLISLISSALAHTSEIYYLGYNVESEATAGHFIAHYGTVYLKSTLEAYAAKYEYAFAAVNTSTPMLYYLAGLAGLLSRMFNGGIVWTTFFIKLFATAADIGVVIIIYKLLEKRLSKLSALLMCALYAALPIVFSISAGWGLSEAVTVFLITLAMYYVINNNYWGAAFAYFAAFTFSVNAIYMLPIILCYAVSQFINRKKMRLPIILSLVGGFALFYLVTLPFAFQEIKEGSAFAAVIDYYEAVFVDNNVYTANAFNFQAMLKNNFETVTTESLFITILFDVFVIALVAAGYFKNKNRMELTLLGALLVCMLFTFTNGMTPVTMYMALPLMFIYAAMNKEKRVYWTTILYALLMFINASYVYMVAGYTTMGIERLSYDGNALMYVFGAFNVLLTAYFIYVVYDIIASRKASRIKPLEITYLDSLRLTARKTRKFFRKLVTR